MNLFALFSAENGLCDLLDHSGKFLRDLFVYVNRCLNIRIMFSIASEHFNCNGRRKSIKCFQNRNTGLQDNSAKILEFKPTKGINPIKHLIFCGNVLSI